MIALAAAGLGVTLAFVIVMMPRFFRDMPAPASGRWVAVVIKATEFGSREARAAHVNGLLRAYIFARVMALAEDARTPSGVGIKWAIRKP